MVEQGLEGTLATGEIARGWVPSQNCLAGHVAETLRAGWDWTGARPSQVWNMNHALWLSRNRGV